MAQRVDHASLGAPQAYQEALELADETLALGGLPLGGAGGGARRCGERPGRSKRKGEEEEKGGWTEDTHERLLSGEARRAAAGMAAGRGLSASRNGVLKQVKKSAPEATYVAREVNRMGNDE